MRGIKTLKHTLVFTVLTLLLAIMLTACGGSTAPTATSAPAATTAAAPATTSAPVATTAAPPATTASVANANNGIGLSFPNWKEIPLDKELVAAIKKQTPGDVPGLTAQLFVTDEADIAKAAQDVDKAFNDAGYKGADGKQGIATTPDGGLGFYVKNGAPDALLFVSAVTPATLEGLKVEGVSADLNQKLLDQVKGKKFAMSLISGKDIAKAFTSPTNTTATPAASTSTGASTTTPTPAPTTGAGGGSTASTSGQSTGSPAQASTSNVTYEFDSDLATDQVDTIKKGIEQAQKVLGDVGAIKVRAGNSVPTSSGKTNVESDTMGSATPGYVEIYTVTKAWQTSNATERLTLMYHEYFHLLQYVWLKGQTGNEGPNTVDKDGPQWLGEGTAEYISYRVAANYDLLKFDPTKISFFDEAKGFKMPLNELETIGQTSSAGRAHYSLGFLATDYLVINHGGEANLKKYYEEVGNGTPWQTAFQKVFGISIDDFYKKFASYRTANFPPN